MPELPEVETVRLQLMDTIVGKSITAVEVFHAKSVGFDDSIEDKLEHKIISSIDRVGKLLMISFVDESDRFLLIHLKMTGQLLYLDTGGDIHGGGHSMTEADVMDLPGKHTRVAFHFSDRTSLFFNDMRLFGYTKVVDRATLEMARSGFGPEPTDPEFDTDWFVASIRKRKAPVKAVLLDQAFVAGLGNIYVDEALWRARVHPTRLGTSLSSVEARAIASASGDVMLESIRVGGTTFQHFRDTSGKRGNFTDQLQVFAKQGTACKRCGTIIVKIKAAGRGTHFCPGCQK